ncbi:membrane protein [Crucian carp herpesvirus]|uniref:Membrane protein ORF124 n=1 Tax=Cyprinid herpesvirus 2 TaxID=317878 RepID=K7PBQ0_CYHV2|nr:membrane protein ORF124 [Cyprinid herpesvirus 2]AFJ20546.1 membrane protein ORF124 [Cyprinid herpesvirus 2]AKC02064.1 hypothetical protein [Cyprinid herpesvirus 2]APB92965.2 membrane protein [Crucian carp herpesvirus]QAU54843.1 membrane protein ORF124 [Cyprinid herpesvirus 2]
MAVSVYLLLVLLSPQKEYPATLTTMDDCVWVKSMERTLTIENKAMDFAEAECGDASLKVAIREYKPVNVWTRALAESVHYSDDDDNGGSLFVNSDGEFDVTMMSEKDGETVLSDAVEGGPNVPGIYFNPSTSRYYNYHPMKLLVKYDRVGPNVWTVTCKTTSPATARLMLSLDNEAELDANGSANLTYDQVYGAWCKSQWLNLSLDTYIMDTPSSAVLFNFTAIVLVFLMFLFGRKMIRSRLGGIRFNIIKKSPVGWNPTAVSPSTTHYTPYVIQISNSTKD